MEGDLAPDIVFYPDDEDEDEDEDQNQEDYWFNQGLWDSSSDPPCTGEPVITISSKLGTCIEASEELINVCKRLHASDIESGTYSLF